MNRQVSTNDKRPLNRNERRKLRTRNQLKQATAELLIEIGYDDLTIQKITDRADLARATFYIHFKDKEEAVWAILADSFAELSQLLWTSTAESAGQRRYEKWVQLFSYVGEHRPLMEVLLGEKGHIKLVQRMQGFMAASLVKDLTSGRAVRTTGLPIEFEAQFYTGAVFQVIVWWLQERPSHTPEQLAEMVYKIVLREPLPQETA